MNEMNIPHNPYVYRSKVFQEMSSAAGSLISASCLTDMIKRLSNRGKIFRDGWKAAFSNIGCEEGK
jgi:hypothetical protein